MNEIYFKQRNLEILELKELLVNTVNIAFAARKSSTYYHTKNKQIKATRSHINSLYSYSKELPLLFAIQKNVNAFFIQEALLNEFKNTVKGGKCNIIDDYYWKSKFSDIAIYLALNNLYNNGIPSVLRLFLLIKDNKINNNRTKRFILNFIWKLDNLEFYAVKYRNKIAKILRHVYGEKTLSILLNIAQKILSKKKVFCVTEKESLILEMYVKRYSIFEIEKSLKLLLFI